MTATEAARSFSAVLNMATRGETIQVTRDGELVASIVPPHRPNGAAILDAYASIEPDPAFAADFEANHRWINAPMQVHEPWDED
jgi:antitoxin (DNA-binding transcriptional repressor) of toxin-antitoxin stability system